MASPFPGMDPFLEGQAWEDFHQGFIGELAAALVPLVRPRYVVRKELRIYVDRHNGADRMTRGDVSVVDSQPESGPSLEPAGAGARTITPVLVGLPVPKERREAFLTIRERESTEVVTVVEVLSPANKHPGSDGRKQYLRKPEDVLSSNANLVELDLLSGGQRLPTVDPLPAGDYFALVCRAQRRNRTEVFAWHLRDALPKTPIPLAAEDQGTQIDLQAVFTSTYDRAGYDYSIDYEVEIQPSADPEQTGWMQNVLSSRQS